MVKVIVTRRPVGGYGATILADGRPITRVFALTKWGLGRRLRRIARDLR